MAATKNSVFRFLKDELQMDEKTRNSLKIQSIYSSKNEGTSILYLQCESQDDIAEITSRAVNLNHQTCLREEPSIVPHVPKKIIPGTT